MEEKPAVNVVFLGNENTGKSTIIGHLLHLQQPNVRVLERFEKLTAERGDPHNKFACISNQSEQVHAAKVCYSLLETETVSFTLFDVSGRRKWTGNLIAGTSCADIAVLVVSAERGEFEIDTGRFAQSKEHMLIAYTLGVKQFVVAINKIDTCNAAWAAQRYEEITKEVSVYISRVGYNSSKVSFIPISGWHGWNLTALAALPWYTGPTLLQVLLAFPLPKRSCERPFRLSVLDVYKIGGIGTVAVGRVQAGSLAQGSNIAIEPHNMVSNTTSIERHHMALEKADAGSFVGLRIRGISARDIERGFVISSNVDKIHICVRFTAHVIVLFHPGQIRLGYRAMLYTHTAKTICRFTLLKATIDRRTGRVKEDTPGSVQTGDALLCVLQPEKPICVQPFAECQALGRFILRDMGITMAVGIIKEVET